MHIYIYMYKFFLRALVSIALCHATIGLCRLPITNCILCRATVAAHRDPFLARRVWLVRRRVLDLRRRPPVAHLNGDARVTMDQADGVYASHRRTQRHRDGHPDGIRNHAQYVPCRINHLRENICPHGAVQ